MPPRIDAATIVAKACAAAFGRPLVVNYLRSMLVEAMIAEALPSKWRWVSADWAAWDFETSDKLTTLEVKQSAARQSWPGPASKASFDIASRTGHWVGNKWTEGIRRYGDIYVFAHHPIDASHADHRDPHQWLFYVVAEAKLPPSPRKTISLSAVRRLATPVGFAEVAAQVEGERSRRSPASDGSASVTPGVVATQRSPA